MSVSATVTPGKIFGSTEVITISSLNKLGSPTVDISGAVGSLSLSDGSVTNAKVAAGTGVQLDKLETGTSAQVIIANSSGDGVWVALSGDVTTSNAGVTAIGNDKVLTANILDANVTTAKIADDAVDGTKLAMGDDAQGDVIYFDGTDYVRLGPGADGEFLQTQGENQIPQWATPVDTSVPLLVVFTTGSNNWTVPSGVTRIRVVLIGGGGSSSAYGTTEQGVGAGGAGGYVEKNLAVTPDDTIQFDVGAGGAASAWNNNGFDGNDSTFAYDGITYTAGGGGKGGGSGGSTADAGVGGTATGGDLNVAAQGYDAYGQGGQYGFGIGTDGAAGVYFGAGGICGSSADHGGPGADGLIRVEY